MSGFYLFGVIWVVFVDLLVYVDVWVIIYLYSLSDCYGYEISYFGVVL